MPRWRPERWMACGIAFSATCGGAAAQLEPIALNRAEPPRAQTLRLEVLVNGRSTHLIEPFVLTPAGVLSATRGDLNQIGIKVTGAGSPRQPVDLHALDHVSYRFDAAGQRIDFNLSDAQRVTRVYDANDRIDRAPPARSDWGAVMGYGLYGTTTRPSGALPRFSGINATLDTRVFSPFGNLEQTEIVGTTAGSRREQLRLDTTYTYSDPDWAVTGRVGDTISGSLPWTRPIRYAGLQAQRNFALRSDIVTLPLPTISGSAAVPSTVDVFVNSVKTYTQDVGTGPYSLTNLPILASSGSANVVVTDVTGRQSESTLPLFTATTLLAPGLTDYSLDAGFAREWYGTFSDDYDPRPIASATVRQGLTDWLTLEGHAEGGAGLVNAGAGAAVRLSTWGTLSAASSGSDRQGSNGGQVFGAYDLQLGSFSIDASAQRTFGRFEDLASVSDGGRSNGAAGAATVRYLSLDPRPPRALDRISVTFPLWFDTTTLSFSLIDGVQADRSRVRVIAASLTRQLPYEASIFATAFVDLSDRRGGGLFAGLSFPLGERARVSLGGGDGANDVEIVQPLQHEDGSAGWRVRAGTGSSSLRAADVSYRSAYGTANVSAVQGNRTLGAQGEIDGSIGAVGLVPFISNRVDDGFALVEAGAPHVPVLQDNRTIGETDAWGHYVVTDMSAYQRNQIGIDPARLPDTAEAHATHQVVVPASKSGVALDFGVEIDVAGALMSFHDAKGRPVPAGARGTIDGRSDSFVVGYDGQAYLKHLAPSNAVTIEAGDLECHATFAYRATATRVTLGPVECR